MYKMRLALEPSDDEDDRLATVKLTLTKESSGTELILFHFDYYFCDILDEFFDLAKYYDRPIPEIYCKGKSLAEGYFILSQHPYFCMPEEADEETIAYIDDGRSYFLDRSISAGGGRGYPISNALCNDVHIHCGLYQGRYEISWEDVNGQFFQYEVDIPDFYQDLHKKYFHVFEKFLNGQPYSLR